MRYTFHGVRLVDATTDQPQANLSIDGEQISASGPARDGQSAPNDENALADHVHIDARGTLLVPGFLDVHTHGGGGYALHTSDPYEIRRYAHWVASTGVTGFLAGVVGAPGGLPEEQLRAAVAATEDEPDDEAGEIAGARMLGIHLEGPYLSGERRGAHRTSWLRMPDARETERLLELTRGALRILTVAPELEGAEALIRSVTEAGVTVSIGHTNATYDQTRAAISWGARHATHCANAMRPLHQREPGPLAAIAEEPQVLGELIADGHHMHPAMLRLLVRLLSPERAIAITDALTGAGTPAQTFELNGQPVRVSDGAAHLADGTLAGSVLTMDQALRNLLDFTDLSLSQAVGMLTRNPARAVGMERRKESLAAGYDADLVLLDPALQVQTTIRGGRLIYTTPKWRERLAGIVASK